jgi:rhodanese-related sulfurtransferase
LRQLRIARITVEELKRRLDEGDAVAVIDLRHPLDFESDPETIPGAIYLPAEDLGARLADVPRDRDVILYCTCSDEITAAKEALRLRRHGIRRVRPLQGGLTAWREAGLATEQRAPVVPIDERMLNAA